MNTPETNVWIRNFAWRTFRDAADEDYLAARYAVKLGLPYQFYWNGQQAIEKYLKCSLVLNGRSAKGFGHNLVSLFKTVRDDIAPSLLPNVYCPPTYFCKGPLTRNYFEPIYQIVSRFNSNGATAQRYRTLGSEYPTDDLHKLDELIFYFRRVCFPLDMTMDGSVKSYKQLLTERPDFQPHPHFSVFSQKKGNRRREIFKILSWQNFTFYEGRALRMKKYSPGGIGFVNSALNMAIQSEDIKHRATLSWALENIEYSKDIRNEIQSQVDTPERP